MNEVLYERIQYECLISCNKYTFLCDQRKFQGRITFSQKLYEKLRPNHIQSKTSREVKAESHLVGTLRVVGERALKLNSLQNCYHIFQIWVKK